MTQLLDLREAAKELGLSIYTLRSWTSQRKIPFVRLGRRILMRRQDLEDFVTASLVLPRKMRE